MKVDLFISVERKAILLKSLPMDFMPAVGSIYIDYDTNKSYNVKIAMFKDHEQGILLEEYAEGHTMMDFISSIKFSSSN